MKKSSVLITLQTILLSLFSSVQVLANEPWQPNQSYQIGQVVTQHEERFIATLWNKDNAPSVSLSHWDGWVKVDDSIPLFELGSDYHSGDVVEVYGELYLAKWGNRNEQPESSWYWRRLGKDDYVDVSGSLEVIADDPKSAYAILGEDQNRNSIRDSYEAQVFALYPSLEQQRLAMNYSYINRAMHELELDESINLLEEEATEIFHVLTAWDSCITLFQSHHAKVRTPLDLYVNTIYRALFYRFGQNEAYRDLNGSEDWIRDEHERDYCQYYELTAN